MTLLELVRSRLEGVRLIVDGVEWELVIGESLFGNIVFDVRLPGKPAARAYLVAGDHFDLLPSEEAKR